MEGRRSSPAALLLLLLALVLAAGSLAATAQLLPPAGTRYVLVTLQYNRGEPAKFTLRAGGHASVPAVFANRRVDIPGQGLADLLGGLVIKKGAR
ncbi:unnamed protein product [Urochloa humidicola]